MRTRFFLLLVAGIGWMATSLSAAEPNFVSGLSESEKDSIGVSGMSAEQLIALEKAVERYVAGRSEQAVAVATAEVREVLVQEIAQRDEQLSHAQEKLVATQTQLHEQQAKAADEENKPSLVERAMVLLRPGTQIEYTTLESRLTEPFKGWKIGTEFRLENGQIWRVAEGQYWSPEEDAGKAVSIEPGSLGSFFIRIEGVRPTPRVILVGTF